jgi:Fe-S cluster assembly protein SufD
MKIDTMLNYIPALTWNWLDMNRAQLKAEIDIKDNAGPSVPELPEGVTFSGVSGSPMPAATGMGKTMDQILDTAGASSCTLTVKKGIKAAVPVVLRFALENGSTSFTRQIIRAEDDSDITVIMEYTSPAAAGGFHAVQTGLYAGKNAHIHLIKVQLLGKDYTHLDDTGATCDESALIQVTQIELGAKESYAGVAADLPAYGGQFKSDTAYLCRGTQKLDMNYVVVHTGKKTNSRMQVKGTVKDTARKTYRGSIDFRRGCSGATGNEQEETLLLSPDVVNKSIPLILCDEEDVAGEHGASIGRLGEDVLFYMNTRGISRNAAEQMLSRAKVQSAAALIPDEKTVTDIHNYMEEVFLHG